MAELTPFGQSLQAQGGASALLRLQGYTPGTREYKRAYDVLYNLSTGRQKGTAKYENIRAGVEQRAERQRQTAATGPIYRPSRLAVSGEIKVSDEWETRGRISVGMPIGFDIDDWERMEMEEQSDYVRSQFSYQFYQENGITPELDIDDYWFE